MSRRRVNKFKQSIGTLCFVCGKISNFSCKQCATTYCTEKCHLSVWQTHKKYCGKNPINRTMQYLEDEKISRTSYDDKDLNITIHRVVKIGDIEYATIHTEYLYKSKLKKCECRNTPSDTYNTFGMKIKYCSEVIKFHESRKHKVHTLCFLYHDPRSCPLERAFLLVMYRFGVSKDIRIMIFNILKKAISIDNPPSHFHQSFDYSSLYPSIFNAYLGYGR